MAYSLYVSFLIVCNNKLFNLLLAAECDEGAKSNTANTNVHICNIIFQQFGCEESRAFSSFHFLFAATPSNFIYCCHLGYPQHRHLTVSFSSSVSSQRGQKVKFSFGTTLMCSECVCVCACLSACLGERTYPISLL